MRIIKPNYEILSEINGVEMLKHIEKIGRVCYKSEDKITEDGESARKFVKTLIDRGHEAMIEHSSLSVKFIVDRGVSHELVRHRIASFAQESTRYCNYSNDKFGNEITVIMPEWLPEDVTGQYDINWNGLYGETSRVLPTDFATVWWFWSMATAERDYFKLIEKGWQPQQARSVLPNSLKTEITITTNLREWRHFFKLRTPITAHPQMREVTRPLLTELKGLIPIIFDDIIVSD
jgi:thymidylate synthase (FAD)